MEPTPGTSRDFRLDYSDEINDLDDYLPEERQAGSKSRDCSDEEGEIDEIENYKPQPRDTEDPADPLTDQMTRWSTSWYTLVASIQIHPSLTGFTPAR